MRLLPKDLCIKGDGVYLRPITVEDTDMVLGWRNSDFVVKEFFYRLPISKEEHLNWLENKVFAGLVHQFVIFLEEGDIPVGCAYMQHYDPSDNTIESGIFMSPDTPKGKGIGTRAFKLFNLEVGFKQLGVDRIITKVIAANVPSCKMNLRCGFHEMGRCMEKIVPDGTEVETVIFEMNKVNGESID